VQIQTLQKYMAIIRDAGSFLLGTFVILYQILTRSGNLDSYMLGLALVGVPGAVGAIALRRGSTETPPTPEPQQPSQPPLPQAERHTL
jgi:hypothetical protein